VVALRALSWRKKTTWHKPSSWPTIEQQREALAGLRTAWLVPYRARRTHCVMSWSGMAEVIARGGSEVYEYEARTRTTAWLWGPVAAANKARAAPVNRRRAHRRFSRVTAPGLPPATGNHADF